MSYLERDTFVEINLNNLRHNIREVKKTIGKTKIIAVVKADAYGHGVLQVSRVFEEEGVDYFGVALLEEAFELRSLGIKKPILVQSSIPYNMIEDAVKDEITISISDIETAKLVSAVSIKLKKEAVAHIKVDTGLHRFGILPENVLDFVQKIKRLPGIYIEGIYTHMASKKSTGEEYAKMKIKVFLKVLEELKQKGYKFSLKHMACSAFVGEFPETILDIIRVGTLFYKIRHIEGFDLKSVMSLKSRVCFVKRVPAGSYISYGTLYRTEKETNIVVINIGYSDGLPRGLSKTGEVLIRGKRFPIAGFISMNNTMVDVGDEDIGVGEEVVIMGSQGQENISNDEISSKLQTSTGEFPTRLSHRIPRIYIGEKG